VLQKMSDPVLSVCPACGASAYVKQVTAAGFQLKGSGWYVTDFRGDNKTPASAPEGAKEGAANGAEPGAALAAGDAAKPAAAAPVTGQAAAPAPMAAPAPKADTGTASSAPGSSSK